jgi:predicted dinucleotide-binding enzyme
MQFAVLGTGLVGRTIATKLCENGHAVCMGSRTAENEAAAAWASERRGATHGTFAQAAAFGEVLFNCTPGQVSMAVLETAREHLAGKVLVDLANPLDFSQGFPPTLFVSNDDSLGEQIQRAFPDLRVVKSLNTVNSTLMIAPERLSESHTLFVSGNDPQAKEQVTRLLQEEFGWQDVLDLGDITTARGTEMLLPAWLRLWKALGTAEFNWKVVR